MNFYESWCYLEDHNLFNLVSAYTENGEEKEFKDTRFGSMLDVQAVKVCPESLHIEQDGSRNTKLQIWLEPGVVAIVDDEAVSAGDYGLHCGGDTFEEAIIKLAQIVKGKRRFKYAKPVVRRIKSFGSLPSELLENIMKN